MNPVQKIPDSTFDKIVRGCEKTPVLGTAMAAIEAFIRPKIKALQDSPHEKLNILGQWALSKSSLVALTKRDGADLWIQAIPFVGAIQLCIDERKGQPNPFTQDPPTPPAPPST